MSTAQWKREHVEEMRASRRKHYYANKEQYFKRVKEREAATKKFVAEYKAERGCERCGEKDVRCLDLHHRDPAKKEHAVSQMYRLGRGIARVMEEIIKCSVLCANCHRKEHTTGR